MQDKTPQAEDVVTVTLVDPDGRRLPDWTPGAHIDLVLPNGLTRQYSLCGDRWDAYTYRIGVLREPAGRGGSAFVHEELEPVTSVGVGGPRNNFPLVPVAALPVHRRRYRDHPDPADDPPGGPDRRRLAAALRRPPPRRRWRSWTNSPATATGSRPAAGPSTGCSTCAEFLGDAATTSRSTAAVPARCSRAVEEGCARLAARTLRTERFVAAGARPPVRDDPFEVELARSGVDRDRDPGQSVLDAVQPPGWRCCRRAGQGTCGTCETTVLAGVPDHRDSLLDDDDRAAGDCMYICVSRSCTDRLVLDL